MIKEYKRIICLFEQSGTFKNEARKLGYESLDYDICNEFNETDIIIDLFNEIEKAYNNKKSIFDDFKENDILLCFFPCTRFSKQALLTICCNQSQLLNKSQIEKVEHNRKEMEELRKLYDYFTKLYHIILKRHLHAIIENPYDEQSFLIRYFPIKPRFIHKNRMEWGDYFIKPTMYYFINHEWNQKIILEPITVKKQLKISELPKGIKRSLISPEYAERFIKEVI